MKAALLAVCFFAACQPLDPVAVLETPRCIARAEPFLADGSASQENLARIVEYHWSFNDGSPTLITVEPKHTHRFLTNGHGTVTLKIVDAVGRSSTVTNRVWVGTCTLTGTESQQLPETMCGVEGDAPCDLVPTTPCLDACSIDVLNALHDCEALRMESLGDGQGTARVVMHGYSTMMATLTVCDASGWTFHLTDSIGGNGGGGDAAQSSNDAEVQIENGRLAMFSNEHPTPGALIRAVDDYVPACGCVKRTLWVGDSRVGSSLGCFEEDSESLLRINPPSDDEGTPDAYWFMGLNRTYAAAGRSGRGLVRVDLCFF